MKYKYNYDTDKYKALLTLAGAVPTALLSGYVAATLWLSDPIKALWVYPVVLSIYGATLYLMRNRSMVGMVVRDWIRKRRMAPRA